jgi:hypothetical protein
VVFKVDLQSRGNYKVGRMITIYYRILKFIEGETLRSGYIVVDYRVVIDRIILPMVDY